MYKRRVGDSTGRNSDHILKACRDSNGQILSETPTIMNRWKQHFRDLLGGSEMEVNCMGKETEQETNEAEEMLNENEYPNIEDILRRQ
jgi:hypothetical protein